jgi:hypothetical protein
MSVEAGKNTATNDHNSGVGRPDTSKMDRNTADTTHNATTSRRYRRRRIRGSSGSVLALPLIMVKLQERPAAFKAERRLLTRRAWPLRREGRSERSPLREGRFSVRA